MVQKGIQQIRAELDQFGADAAVEAERDGRAFVDFDLEDAGESWPALALETLQRVAVGAAVLALLAREAQGAQAAVVSLHVLALAAIEAGIARAFVHLDAVVGARPAGLAEAQSAEEDVDAGSVLSARRRRSVQVHFGHAPLPGESGRTGASEIVNKVDAVVDVVGAEWTFLSDRVDALETALF